jgi:hypothetical protein
LKFSLRNKFIKRLPEQRDTILKIFSLYAGINLRS